MRVCCARMTLDVLNDVEDGVIAIVPSLSHAAFAYGKHTSSRRTSCCVLGRIVIYAE
jgi:hypothetical protein